MKCKVCLKVECKEKLFIPKLDNLSKHIGNNKAKVTMKGVQTNFLKKLNFFNMLIK